MKDTGAFSPGIGTLRAPIDPVEPVVSTLSRPPVEPLNAVRGMWAWKEGGVVTDVRASAPFGAYPRGSGYRTGLHLGPGTSPMVGGVVSLWWGWWCWRLPV